MDVRYKSALLISMTPAAEPPRRTYPRRQSKYARPWVNVRPQSSGHSRESAVAATGDDLPGTRNKKPGLEPGFPVLLTAGGVIISTLIDPRSIIVVAGVGVISIVGCI